MVLLCNRRMFRIMEVVVLGEMPEERALFSTITCFMLEMYKRDLINITDFNIPSNI